MTAVLADTSVWIKHLHQGESVLEPLLLEARVYMHPFIIGELACGNLPNRTEVLKSLNDLPKVPIVFPDEMLFFIEQHGLMGTGIGYTDAHLLAAASISSEVKLLTLDRKLDSAASKLGLSANYSH